MAADLFLKIEGIEGESQDAKHKKEIELMSWGLHESNPGSFKQGSGGGTGGVTMEDFTFSKTMDAASANLFLFCASGKHIKEVVFSARKSGGGESPEDYLNITLNECLISNYSTGGGAGGGVPTESFSIDFAKIKVQYKQQQKDGTMQVKGTALVDLSGGKAAKA